jgi:hypothetical protein
VIPNAINLFSGQESDQLGEIIINETAVFEKLNNLNTNKSQGPDEIHPKLLYELRHELVKAFTVLFSKSLKLGEVPRDWRDANVLSIAWEGE